MRRIWMVLLVVFLTGCSTKNSEMDRALAVRNQLLKCSGVAFQVQITADYGETVYQFSMDCTADNQGNLSFQVLTPETIQGITGTVSTDGGKLTYDGTLLAFDLLADGQISPVSAPWLLIKTLRGGYISSCTQEEDAFRLSVDDSYADDALHLEIWLDANEIPYRAEIYWQEKCVVTLCVSDFKYL